MGEDSPPRAQRGTEEGAFSEDKEEAPEGLTPGPRSSRPLRSPRPGPQNDRRGAASPARNELRKSSFYAYDPTTLQLAKSAPTVGKERQENRIPLSPFLCHDSMPMRALTGDGVNDSNTDGHRFAALSQIGTDWGGGRPLKNSDEGSSRSTGRFRFPNPLWGFTSGRSGSKLGFPTHAELVLHRCACDPTGSGR